MRYEFLSNLEILSIKVLSIGCTSDIEISKVSKCSRGQFIIHYITDGIGYFNGIQVKGGEGFIIPPNFFAEYHPDKENPWTMFWIILNPESYEKCKSLYQTDKNFIFKYNFSIVIKMLSEQIYKNSIKNYSQYDSWKFFSTVLSNQIEELKEINKRKKISYAENAKNYIDVYFSENIKVSQICSYLNISQPYLYKTFKEKYQISVKKYIENMKIKHAEMLLTTSDLNISQIAMSVGFNDVLAFSAFFKKNKGVSPSIYRNQINK